MSQERDSYEKNACKSTQAQSWNVGYAWENITKQVEKKAHGHFINSQVCTNKRSSHFPYNFKDTTDGLLKYFYFLCCWKSNLRNTTPMYKHISSATTQACNEYHHRSMTRTSVPTFHPDLEKPSILTSYFTTNLTKSHLIYAFWFLGIEIQNI